VFIKNLTFIFLLLPILFIVCDLNVILDMGLEFSTFVNNGTFIQVENGLYLHYAHPIPSDNTLIQDMCDRREGPLFLPTTAQTDPPLTTPTNELSTRTVRPTDELSCANEILQRVKAARSKRNKSPAEQEVQLMKNTLTLITDESRRQQQCPVSVEESVQLNLNVSRHLVQQALTQRQCQTNANSVRRESDSDSD
jgi:hypothetical protein